MSSQSDSRKESALDREKYLENPSTMGYRSTAMKELITEMSLDDIRGKVVELGFRPFVADQIAAWVYKKNACLFSEMTNLSKDARETFSERFDVDALAVVETLLASDGTKKFLCKAKSDGALVECVDSCRRRAYHRMHIDSGRLPYGMRLLPHRFNWICAKSNIG